jgi:excisionase family DNA binding protein
MTPRQRLATVLAPEALDALEELVGELVTAKLAETVQNSHAAPWLSIREAAAYLAVSERTIEREIARGRLQSCPFGRRRLLHRDALDVYVRAAGEE